MASNKAGVNSDLIDKHSNTPVLVNSENIDISKLFDLNDNDLIDMY